VPRWGGCSSPHLRERRRPTHEHHARPAMGGHFWCEIAPRSGTASRQFLLTQLCLSVAVASVPVDSLAHRRIKTAQGAAPYSKFPSIARPHRDCSAWPYSLAGGIGTVKLGGLMMILELHRHSDCWYMQIKRLIWTVMRHASQLLKRTAVVNRPV
jgi:hypothetical protein